MTLIQLSNGGALIEERYSFPDPEIVIRSVFRTEDIKYLKARNASETSSIVYFYGDRDYQTHLTSYVGETHASPLSRYQNTHSKKEWCQNLKYPVIGMVESVLNPWDVETRKSIEALTAYKLKKQGFQMVNAENLTWSNGVNHHPTVNSAYAESVANIIVAYKIANIGLAGTDIRKLAKSLGQTFDETPDYKLDNPNIKMEDFPNPKRISSTEKFAALIRSGQILISEPLHTTHRLIHRAVILRSPTEVEYRGALYEPRAAIKAMAHEAHTEGLTIKQSEGWNSYDPFSMLAVTRNDEKIKLSDLWKKIKPAEMNNAEENEVLDEDWYTLVTTNDLPGAIIVCNKAEGLITENARIQWDNKSYPSHLAFGEAVNGLNDDGWGEFQIIHNGETYNINAD